MSVEATRQMLCRHVPGAENSADLLSRGCTPDVLDNLKDEWLHSRTWLMQEESMLPVRSAEELVLTDEQEKDISKEIQRKAESHNLDTRRTKH